MGHNGCCMVSPRTVLSSCLSYHIVPLDRGIRWAEGQPMLSQSSETSCEYHWRFSNLCNVPRLNLRTLLSWDSNKPFCTVYFFSSCFDYASGALPSSISEATLCPKLVFAMYFTSHWIYEGIFTAAQNYTWYTIHISGYIATGIEIHPEGLYVASCDICAHTGPLYLLVPTCSYLSQISSSRWFYSVQV